MDCSRLRWEAAAGWPGGAGGADMERSREPLRGEVGCGVAAVIEEAGVDTTTKGTKARSV